MNAKQRVLVTGATGFIGRQSIKPLLDLGYEVHAIGRAAAPPAYLPKEIFWHQHDVFTADVKALMHKIRPHAMLHFAWYVEHGKFWHAPENWDWVDISKQLLEAFAAVGGKRFIGVGSCVEYDWNKLHGNACNEATTPLHSEFPYGAAKDSFRRYTESYATNHDISFAWGRIFLVHGEGEPKQKLIPSVIQSLLRGEEAKVSACTQMRDMMHTASCGEAFARLLDSQVTGAVNIASGKPHNLRDYLEYIHKTIGKGQIHYGALPARGNEPEVLIADISRLKNEVGYQPSDPLDDLNYSIQYWQSQMFK